MNVFLIIIKQTIIRFLMVNNQLLKTLSHGLFSIARVTYLPHLLFAFVVSNKSYFASKLY